MYINEEVKTLFKMNVIRIVQIIRGSFFQTIIDKRFQRKKGYIEFERVE